MILRSTRGAHMLFFEALWIFLPILAANQGPGLARGLKLPFSTVPVSQRWLGENKTVAAYCAGPILAIPTAYFCGFENFWSVGFALGLGAILGDHVKSFFKRRQRMKPGEPWWPWDQTDYAFGGLFGAYFVVDGLWVGQEAIVMLLALLVHPIGNRIGFWLGFRKVPW